MRERNRTASAFCELARVSPTRKRGAICRVVRMSNLACVSPTRPRSRVGLTSRQSKNRCLDLIERFTHFPRKGGGRERFLKKGRARFLDAVPKHCVVGVAG